jgi:hypothetical protein
VLHLVSLNEEVIEDLGVLFASHEGRRQVLHENFSELTVTNLNNLREDGVILLKVRSDQVQLVLALHECLNFDLGLGKSQII